MIARDHQADRRLLLDQLLATQARLTANLGPGVHRRTRASLLRRIAADLGAVFVVLAAERLPGRPALARSVEAADDMLAAAGVWDDQFIMPRCRAAVRQAGRAALAEDVGRGPDSAAVAVFLEIVTAHAATTRDLADDLGNEMARDLAVERHRRALVALDNLDVRPDPLAVPPLPSESPAMAPAT